MQFDNVESINKKIFFLLMPFFLTTTICVTAQVKKLSLTEMQQDLNYLDKHLSRWHPTYYDYTKRIQMDAHYANLKNEIDCTKTIAEFRTIVRRAVSKVGCGHIDVYMPKGTVSQDSVMRMPLDVYCFDNKLFVRKYNNTDSLLTIGEEILSINQIKTDSLIKTLGELETSDGFNITKKATSIERYFNWFHYQVYGVSNEYVIEKKDKDNNVSTVRIRPKKISSTIYIYQKKPDSTRILIKGNGVSLYKTTFDPKTAVIDLDNFDGKGQYKTFRKIFKYVRENNIQHLVVDMRDNGGGNVGKGNVFLSYFRKPLIFGATFSRKPRLLALNPNFKMGFWERITPFLFLGIPFQYPSKDGWNHFIPFVRKFKNHYDNKVYVITNGNTFSMAAYVASVLKNKENAITVGTESGGSIYASRGMAGGSIRLPNSKINVDINIYQLKYAKRSLDDGFGVKPNYEVEYTIQEKLESVDKELITIEKIIKNNKF